MDPLKLHHWPQGVCGPQIRNTVLNYFIQFEETSVALSTFSQDFNIRKFENNFLKTWHKKLALA